MREYFVSLYDTEGQRVPLPHLIKALQPFRSTIEAVSVGRIVRVGTASRGADIGFVVSGPDGVVFSENLDED